MISLWHKIVTDITVGLATIAAVIAANLGIIQGIVAIVAGLLACAVYATQLYQAWGKRHENL